MTTEAFNFLKAAWGIELLPHAQAEIAKNAESLSRKHIEEYIKDTDIRKFGVVSYLPKEITRAPNSTVPPGKYFVQVQKFADITQPTKFQENFEGGKFRLLALDMSDGDQKFKAIEYVNVKFISVQNPPGTKLLLWSTEQSPLHIQNGHVMLTPDNVELLGGTVDRLVESWYASNEVEETRLLWRTEGVKKTTDNEGAPQWVDFDPRKAPRGGASAAQKQVAEERAEWRQGSTPGKQKATQEKDEGPRFNPDEFVAEGGPSQKVKNQISSTVFAEDPNATRSKGKGKGKGKEKGSKGKGDAGPRHGRSDNWEGGEEKRAPQGTNTLAAFIKPTKKGELPDETLAAFAAPANVQTDNSGWGDAWHEGWTDESWGDGYVAGGGGKGGGKGYNGKGRGKRSSGGAGKGSGKKGGNNKGGKRY